MACPYGRIIDLGEVPERLNGAVSKTVVARWATVGSNPTLSAGEERHPVTARHRVSAGALFTPTAAASWWKAGRPFFSR